MNPFIHHRDDVSGVWKHRMILPHSCGEAVKNDVFCGSCKKELGRLEGFFQWGSGWGMCTLCEKCVGTFHQQRQLQPTAAAVSPSDNKNSSPLLSSSKGKHRPSNTSYPDHLGLVSCWAFTKPKPSQVVPGFTLSCTSSACGLTQLPMFISRLSPSIFHLYCCG